MNTRARLLLAVAAVLVLPSLLLPLWEVRLGAPQYPEGLGLQIWAGKVTGIKPNDLQNINGLNHYIGMKEIAPDAIPELKVMPWVIGALAIAALAIAWRGTRRMLTAWLVAFATLGVIGLVDFWRWEYDYGHNLDMDNAIIVVPGMTYQPPLIGSRQLLNFVATAWPGLGALFLGLGFAVAAGAWYASRPGRVAP
jgi:copper chaperone NosL